MAGLKASEGKVMLTVALWGLHYCKPLTAWRRPMQMIQSAISNGICCDIILDTICSLIKVECHNNYTITQSHLIL